MTALGKAHTNRRKIHYSTTPVHQAKDPALRTTAPRSHRAASFGDDTSIGPTRAKRKPDAES
nr:MAG TPA: hypothetical protein [Caudoviricetes sp.]